MKNKNLTLLSLFVGYAALACAGSAVALLAHSVCAALGSMVLLIPKIN